MNSIQRRGEIAGPDVIVMGFESIEPQGNEINGAATPSYGYGCHARQHHLVCFKEGFIDRKLRDWKFRAIATRYDKLQKIAYRRLILNQYCSLRSPKILLQQYRHST
jgi:hypothetical protein